MKKNESAILKFLNLSLDAISPNEMHEVNSASTSKSIPEVEEETTSGRIRNNEEADVESNIIKHMQQFYGMMCHVAQCFSIILLQRNFPQLFALLMKPYAMIQVSILQQPHKTVVANFVPGNFGLFRRNPG